MARLPIPGGDDGTWGDVLNQFLLTQHNADGTHSLTLNSLSNVNTAGASNGEVLTYSGGSWTPAAGGGGGDPAVGGDLSGTASNAQIVAGAIVNADVNASAAIAQSKIANLTSDLAGKANTSHTHPQSDVTNLTADLAGKADTAHAHTISDVTNLQTTLDAKTDETTLTTKGDLYVATAASTPARQGVGTDGQVLTAASAQSTGVDWTTLTSASVGAIPTSEKGQPNGVAQLDGSGKVTPGQLVTSNITKVLPYSYLGSLVVGAGTFRLYNDMGASWTIAGARASVGTAPAGASIIIDIHKNGTTIFTTQGNRPTIAAAANTSGSVTNMDVTTVAAGEYLTVDIDQVGSSTAGVDLTVQIEVV